MDITYERVPLTALLTYPGNPRRGDVDAIADSLTAHGQYRPIVVNRRTNQVLCGNHTYMAAQALGWDTVEVGYIDVDEVAARKIVLTDNRSHDLGDGYDEAALAALLQDAVDQHPTGADGDGLDGTGFNAGDLDALLANLEDTEQPEHDDEALQGAEPPDVDELPDLPPLAPITTAGTVWLLGSHRLMCGDSRDPEDMATLMDVRAQLAFTSPPYAAQRAYDTTTEFRPIPPEEYTAWFEPVQERVAEHLATNGSWLVNIKPHSHKGQRHLYVHDLVAAHVRQWNWRFVDEFCWTKRGLPGSWPNRLKNGFEPVYHFARRPKIAFYPEQVAHASDRAFTYGDDIRRSSTGNVGFRGDSVNYMDGMALPSNVIDVHPHSKTMQGADHEAAFPVALASFFVGLFTREGQAVLDPFSGSGTTIIAAHRAGRVGYGMEISPRYVDRTLLRWQRETGELPYNVTTGGPVDVAAYYDKGRT